MREILVPYADLDVILQSQARRVFLNRAEYDQLVAKAEKSPEHAAPRATALIAANYQATLEEGRARITGTLAIDVLRDGLHAVNLELDGVGVRSATLDGRAAALGRNAQNRPVAFVEGRGRHTLVLELVTPLATSAAEQSLHYQLPTAPASKMVLVVPGNVEIKSGADVSSREVDAAAGVTRFELLVPRGSASLSMSLNNKLLRKGRVVLARSVVVDEITEAYERLHVTASMEVLHGATDQFRFAAPESFEVTSVSSPLLSRWEVVEENGARVLDVRLREPTSETTVLNISAVKTPSEPAAWKLPSFAALDVAGEVAVVGVLLEERYRLSAITPEGLIPIDTQVLSDALPESVFQAEPGAPRIRPVAAYYAPQAAYALAGSFEKPEARVRVSTNLLLVLSDTVQQVRGGFALLAEAEKIFECDFSVPAGWEVTEVNYEDGQPLNYEIYDAEEGARRVHVKLPRGVPPGQQYSIFFLAVRNQSGWLAPWRTRQIEFPVFRVLDTSFDVGALAVDALDDLVVRPDKLVGLTPLDANKKSQYGLDDVATDLAFRYDQTTPTATLVVERTQPRITARTFSFLTLHDESLTAHYELTYEVDEARTRELSLLLPKDTPAELAIRGLDGVELKEFTGQTDGDVRRWTVRLVEPRRGAIRLAVDFQSKMADSAAPFALPLVRAADVVYQSGVVAVEGSPELDIELTKHPRKVDVGELVDADYQPGRRLLGVFGYTGEDAGVSAKAVRRPGYDLPSAIVQRAELVTLVSSSGVSQTAARFILRTKATMLEVKLPADSELWSTYLDGLPTKPQRENDRLLLSLPADGLAVRDLQIVYETPIGSMNLWGRVEAPAPTLVMRDETGAAGAPLPLADLRWRLNLPAGYGLVRSDGTVFTTEVRAPTLPITRVAQVLFASPGIAGGSEASKWMSTDDVAYRSEPASALAEHADGAAERGDKLDEADYEKSEVAAATPDAAKPAEAPEPRDATARTPPTNAPVSGPPSTTAGVPVQPPPPVVEPYVVTNPDPPEMVRIAEGSPGYGRGNSYWALEGLSSLKIDLQTEGDPSQAIEFTSLGVDPELDVTLVNRARVDMLAWGVAAAILLAGLWLLKRPAMARAKFVLTVILITTLIPVLTGWGAQLGDTLNLACYAACLLIPIYLAVGFAGWLLHRIGHLSARRGAATATGCLLVVLCSNLAHAEPPAASDAPYVIRIAPPAPPVHVPEDAVIIPYDPEKDLGAQKIDQLMVPYQRYVELWNRANPDKKLLDHPAPAPFGLAGASFQARLDGDDHLLVEGHIDVDIFADGVVTVPLTLEGGVLAQAQIAGKPARLQVMQMEPPSVAAAAPRLASNVPALPQHMQQAPAPGVGLAPGPTGSLVALYVSGKERHRLNLVLRYPLERRGGWRVVAGRLPSAPATSLTLIAPRAETEVRLTGSVDRTSYETTKDAEKIETAIAADGSFQAQWRPKISEAMVDRSLTVTSAAVFDAQEDRLRLAWRVDLEFRRGQRESFSLGLPTDYLVEQVAGGNVRGWEVKGEGAQRTLEITLLKAARDREQFVVYLSRRGAVGKAALAEFTVPTLEVADAVLHRGQFAIRRSPLIELRTLDTAGVARTDQMTSTAGLDALVKTESPLGIRGYQAYRFATTPYTVRLAAAATAARTTAELQTLLRVADIERRLESRINLRVEGRPVYRVQVAIPQDLELSEVSAGDWSVTDVDGQRVLNVFLASGAADRFSLSIGGQLGKTGQVDRVALPELKVLDVDRQEGHLVVQADPALEVRAAELKNIESVLLDRVLAWIKPEQRALARLALYYESPDYSGNLKLTVRQARVSATAITNVLVTDKSLEETIYLAYTIADAGVRGVSFRMPVSMRDARISAPLLRQKTIEPIEGDDALVRVRLELQDEVMGDFRVLIENDRLPSTAKYRAPLPVIEDARVTQQFVVVESAGRDEVMIDEQPGLLALSRQQRDWKMLAGLLPGGITQAFLVEPGVKEPRLVMHSQDRAAVETAGARIELAQTVLAVDANGAYRGQQVYFVDNSTEQFLNIQLPAGALLWTARVAGAGVKPTQMPGGAADQVRIPLVKTAAGDANFEVVLKYGGRIAPLGSVDQVTFPLLKTLNINVELSQVRLWLPETYRWFDFGGSMRLVADEGELQADIVAYCTNQIKKFSTIVNGTNPFASVRAKSNLKQLEMQRDALEQSGQQYADNTRLQQELDTNYEVLNRAQAQIRAEVAHEKDDFDNRGRLNTLFEGQYNGRSRNIVNELGSNFDITVIDKSESMQGQGKDGAFSKEWIKGNQLDNANDGAKKPSSRVLVDPEPKPDPAAQPQQGEGQSQRSGGAPFGQNPGQPVAPQIRGGYVQQNGQSLDIPTSQEGRESGRRGGRNSKSEQVQRYAEQIEQTIQEQRGVKGRREQPFDQTAGDALPPQGFPQREANQPAQPGEPTMDPSILPRDFQTLRGHSLLPDMYGDDDGRLVLGAGVNNDAGVVGNVTVTRGAGLGTGLASLDIELPTRGVEFLLTTPRGELEVTARAVANPLIDRAKQLGWIVALLVVAGTLYRAVQKHGLSGLVGRGVATLLILAGLLFVVLGIAPLVALAGIALGIVQHVRLSFDKPQPALA